jgi:hypothetical protein
MGAAYARHQRCKRAGATLWRAGATFKPGTRVHAGTRMPSRAPRLCARARVGFAVRAWVGQNLLSVLSQLGDVAKLLELLSHGFAAVIEGFQLDRDLLVQVLNLVQLGLQFSTVSALKHLLHEDHMQQRTFVSACLSHGLL